MAKEKGGGKKDLRRAALLRNPRGFDDGDSGVELTVSVFKVL